jgi:hypothetical protein
LKKFTERYELTASDEVIPCVCSQRFILGELSPKRWIEIEAVGKKIEAIKGKPIATAVIASGRRTFRCTGRFAETRDIL